MNNFSNSKKIGLAAGLILLISFLIPLLGAGEGENATTISMWNIANGAEVEGHQFDSQPVHYLYFLLGIASLFFTWKDNFKYARIAFIAVIVLFLIQYFTGISIKDIEESKGDLSPEEDLSFINSEIFNKESFTNAKVGVWLLLASSFSGIIFSKK